MQRDNVSVGERIKKLRSERGVTQAQLAAPRYSHGYVSQIESGMKEPSLEALEHFADVLGVDAEYLRTGRDPAAQVAVELRLQEAKSLIYGEGKAAEAQKELERLRADIMGAGFVELEARATETLALAIERQGHIDRALEVFKEAEVLWIDWPIHYKMQTVAGIARCMNHLGDARYSAYLLETYLSELQRDDSPDPTALGRISSALVHAYFSLGMPERAVEAAETARRLEIRIQDPQQLACMNMNVARALMHKGQHDEALDALRRTEEIYLGFGWRGEVARVNTCLAIVHMAKGEYDEARSALLEALDIEKESSQDRVAVLEELGRVERLSGDVFKAKEYLQQSLQLSSDTDPMQRGVILRELAYCSDDAGEKRKLLEDTLELFEKASDPNQRAATLRAMAELAEKEGDAGEALTRYKQALDAVESSYAT